MGCQVFAILDHHLPSSLLASPESHWGELRVGKVTNCLPTRQRISPPLQGPAESRGNALWGSDLPFRREGRGIPAMSWRNKAWRWRKLLQRAAEMIPKSDPKDPSLLWEIPQTEWSSCLPSLALSLHWLNDPRGRLSATERAGIAADKWSGLTKRPLYSKTKILIPVVAVRRGLLVILDGRGIYWWKWTIWVQVICVATMTYFLYIWVNHK